MTHPHSNGSAQFASAVPNRAAFRSGFVRDKFESAVKPLPLPERYTIGTETLALTFSAIEDGLRHPSVRVQLAMAGRSGWEWRFGIPEIANVLGVMLDEQRHAQVGRPSGGAPHLTFFHAGSAIMVCSGKGEETHELKLGPEDAFRVAVILAAQLTRSVPAVVAGDVLVLMQKTLGRMSKCEAFGNSSHVDLEGRPIDEEA